MCLELRKANLLLCHYLCVWDYVPDSVFVFVCVRCLCVSESMCVRDYVSVCESESVYELDVLSLSLCDSM